jgi:sterol desaturase/sphingolipid hydroxylase (fatty acid hydroxylase superfamily)
MHGIHHSDFQSETDSNYSVIFRWWDTIHRSLRLNVNQSIINIGVAGYQEPKDNELWRLLVSPFWTQKEYWVAPDGHPSTKRPDEDSGPLKILAE